MNLLTRGLLLPLLLLAWAMTDAIAAAPPTPPPVSVLQAQTTISVTNTSSRVALATSPAPVAVTIFNSGAVDAYFAQGGSSVVATTGSTLLKAGTHITVWVSSTYVAAITASSTTILVLYEGNGPLQVGVVGAPNGATPTGAAGGDLGGSYPNPIVTSVANVVTGPLSAAVGGAGAITGALRGNGSGVVSQAACADLSNAGTMCPQNANAVAITGGTITGATYNGMSITANSGTLAIGNAKVFTDSNTLTLTSNDGATLAIGGGGTLASGAFAAAYALPVAQAATIGGVFSKAAVSHNFLTSISAADGSIGQAQPACADISDATALCNTSPATGVAAFLATPSSANLATAMTTKTGTAGNLVFSNSPSFTGTVAAAAITGSGLITSNRNGAGFSAVPTTTTNAGWYQIVTAGGSVDFGMDGSTGSSFGTAGNYGTAIYRPDGTGFAVSRATAVDIYASPVGSVVLGSAAVATSATDGFLYIPTSAGAPSGVPTAYTGRIALDYDTTNHQFWIYDGGWKQPKTPAGAATVTWQ